MHHELEPKDQDATSALKYLDHEVETDFYDVCEKKNQHEAEAFHGQRWGGGST